MSPAGAGTSQHTLKRTKFYPPPWDGHLPPFKAFRTTHSTRRTCATNCLAARQTSQPAPRTQQHADRKENRPTRRRQRAELQARLGFSYQSQVKSTGLAPATEGPPSQLQQATFLFAEHRWEEARASLRWSRLTVSLLRTDAKAKGGRRSRPGTPGPGLSQHSQGRGGHPGPGRAATQVPFVPEPGGSQLLPAQGALLTAVGRAVSESPLQSSLASSPAHS